MVVRVILSIAFVVMAAVNVPLVLRRIPPNPLYGFRTRRTLASEAVWYPANAFAGGALLVAALVSLAATWLVPDSALSNPVVVLAIPLGPLLIAVITSFVYLRRL